MKVAIYARVSTQEQSLEPQLIELRSYAKTRGWSVVAELSDVISGVKAERPGLEQLDALIDGKRIGAVLVVKLDRMARSLVHFGALSERLLDAGVALICTSQGIDTSDQNPCGKFQQNILAAVAQFERDLIRERTKAGLVAARARGAVLGRVSARMPGDGGRHGIIAGWIGAGKPDGYRGLGERLGGVSAATAMRQMARFEAGQIKAPQDPAVAA